MFVDIPNVIVYIHTYKAPAHTRHCSCCDCAAVFVYACCAAVHLNQLLSPCVCVLFFPRLCLYTKITADTMWRRHWNEPRGSGSPIQFVNISFSHSLRITLCHLTHISLARFIPCAQRNERSTGLLRSETHTLLFFIRIILVCVFRTTHNIFFNRNNSI